MKLTPLLLATRKHGIILGGDTLVDDWTHQHNAAQRSGGPLMLHTNKILNFKIFRWARGGGHPRGMGGWPMGGCGHVWDSFEWA
eukprot:jgi/Botrbrau1/4317/Bobra.0232s0009.1